MNHSYLEKLKKSVPNALTLGNSVCGFAAIIYTLRAYEKDYSVPGGAMSIFVISAIMIFSAMIFDALDGFAARLLNASSMEGIQMDSLSDMVTFGVAPATLVAIMTHSLRDWDMKWAQEIFVYVLCSFYLGCAALRLAIYNVQAIDPSKKKVEAGHFSGLPTPGAAAAICVMVFYAYEHSYHLDKLAFLLPIYAFVLGILMVSHIQYLHVGRWLISVVHNRRNQVIFIILLAVAIIGRSAGLAAIVSGYILSGPLTAITRAFTRKTSSADTAGK
jgi:CDP-diacylglycerol--serine O-phosphatidyltransferase